MRLEHYDIELDIRQVLSGIAPDRVEGRRYLASQNRYVLGEK